MGLTAVLAERGYALEEIAASHGVHHAIVAYDSADNTRVLLVVWHDNGGVRLLDEILTLDTFKPQISWRELMGEEALRTVLVAVVFDDPVENTVGTHLFVVTDEFAAVGYADPPDACKPARLLDLGGDGRFELISFTENPSGSDCISACHFEIAARFSNVPRWVRIRRWDGSRLDWLSVEHEFPEFYAQLAQVYEEIGEWLQTDDEHAQVC